MYISFKRAGTVSKFFQDSIEIDAVSLYDAILKSYSNIDFILGLDYTDGIELVNKAIERDVDNKLWERWLTLYPFMEMKQMNFVSFNEYKKMLKGTGRYRRMTKEEIYADVDSIIEEFNAPVKEGE